MEVFTLLKNDIEESVRPLTIFLVISGIANALLIGIVNSAAENVSNSDLGLRYFLLFICTFVVIVYTKRYVLDKSSVTVEKILYKIRLRITDKIRHTELSTIESIGTSPLYARLTMDVSTISNMSSNVINSTQGAIMICFTLLYVAYISIWSFLLIILVATIAVLYTRHKMGAFRQLWKVLTIKDTAFFEKLGHILQGFKEIKVNRSKNEDVFSGYEKVNSDLRKTRVKILTSYNFLLILAQISLFIMLGILLFLLPQFHAEHSEDIFKITAAVLFVAGPMEGLVASLESLDNANVAARNIMELEAKLEEELSKNNLNIEAQNRPEVYESLPFQESIHLKGLSYSYPPTKEREHIFTVGPLDLSFRKGELIFITGGNGSGKSTLLKLITGLYPPKSGQIVLDEGLNGAGPIAVSAVNYQQYRNLFSTVFFDFHLFDKLYGMRQIEPNIVNKLLLNMELPEEKVTYRDGAFTNLNLSSGQRKRLVLTTVLIEDNPIYVFDEVAADLDPGFRDKYYYEILRELKERHKTVIVVSHDRHYWTVPDRIFEMDDGNIRELSEEDIQSILTVDTIG